MQRSPPKLDKVLPGLLEQILRLHNIHKVNEPHFWIYHAGYYVASLRLVLENVVTSQKERLTLIWAVREYLKERGFKRTTIEFQLKNDPPYNWETSDPTPLPPEVLDLLGRDWDSKPLPVAKSKNTI
ncbi:hypothetical protein RvY_08099 [Ramazzottius varieornatus]|uniref:Uncharacterized protein n=1 Tax=Ramazzottius varieornatus TaxID=947166 RepID=A0A1D1V4Q5_RAMVA|nr:hypothetical protein RvY_08099 [Ramazzottius varieornatus]